MNPIFDSNAADYFITANAKLLPTPPPTGQPLAIDVTIPWIWR